MATLVLAARPRTAQAHHILGLCHLRTGSAQAAEAAFRTSLKLDRSDEAAAIDLADLLAATDRSPAAETILRSAVSTNRRSVPLTARLANLLAATERPQEALSLLAGLPPQAAGDHSVLAARAAAFKAAGRPDAALTTQRRAAELYPGSPVAHHNLAATLGDLGHFAAAAQSAARAIARGGNAPQTFLVHARALLGCGRLAEAETAFAESLRRDPAGLEALRELVQLIWMRTEELSAALVPLDDALRAHPAHHPFVALRANILHHAGEPDAAYETLAGALQHHADQADLQMAASQQAAICGMHAAALRHAEQAVTARPQDDTAQSVLATACLGAGDAARASAVIGAILQRRPLDQRALAYQATAWRMLGDPRYGALYDYPTLVRGWQMDTPEGWDSLGQYLADLARALDGLHPFKAHPLDQSLRHGSQAANLLTSDDPVIRAFFAAVDGPIRRHLAALGKGSDPLRRRNTGSYRFHGAWSVRLRSGGFHTDHIHPEGWLSSACYIALPEMAGEGQEAWIKFGQPGIPTAPALPAEHVVRPEPGLLVLFPSYMWHGTVPFTSPGARLSVAFDLVPG